MAIVVAGGGKLGRHLASILLEQGRKVVMIEKDRTVAEKLKAELNCTIIDDDACDPSVLKNAGVAGAEVVVAATGHDEDNLIICQLAKFEFQVPRVVARVNNPRNAWLFTKDMGADATVCGAHIIAQLIEEEAEISDLITVLDLEEDRVALLRSIVGEKSKIAHKLVKELPLPSDCLGVLVVRDDRVLVPSGDTIILPGDKILSLVSIQSRDKLKNILE